MRVMRCHKSSIPVAGSNVCGCKLRDYLSLQPFSLFYTFGTNQYNFGTSQKISAFERFVLRAMIYIKRAYLLSRYLMHS